MPIIGSETDLTLNLAARHSAIDDGLKNMPGGEVYYAPVEDSATGTIEFVELPCSDLGTQVEGARLVFRDGVVVDASAREGEDHLLQTLETDSGSRGVGEFGLGCNEGLTRSLGDPLFDEKIAGTIHLALGGSYTHIGGRNESRIRWDLVKDLRRDGGLWCDGELVQQGGRWCI